MFIGGVKISTSSNNQEETECNFRGTDFKNKRLCMESCKDSGCENAYCEYECEKIPICEFETIGRHSVDCIKRCIKNKDCSSEYCIENVIILVQNCHRKKTYINRCL